MPKPIPKFDRVGRPQHDPQKLFASIEGITRLAEWIPIVLVPSEFWALDVVETGGVRFDRNTGHETPLTVESAIVACPCGHDCVVPILDEPTKCEAEDCDCERWFAFTGKDVWAYNSPAKADPQDSDETTVVRQ